MEKVKIMFVCHGNICRSPMAEVVFKDMTLKAGLSDRFLIKSSATSTEEIWGGVGNPVYPPAEAELKKHGLTGAGKRAVQLKKDDYGNYDLFIGMDRYNVKNMLKIFGSDPDNKVKKLLDYVNGADVADPWYTDRFDVCYSDICIGLEALLNSILKKWRTYE